MSNFIRLNTTLLFLPEGSDQATARNGYLLPEGTVPPQNPISLADSLDAETSHALDSASPSQSHLRTCDCRITRGPSTRPCGLAQGRPRVCIPERLNGVPQTRSRQSSAHTGVSNGCRAELVRNRSCVDRASGWRRTFRKGAKPWCEGISWASIASSAGSYKLSTVYSIRTSASNKLCVD